MTVTMCDKCKQQINTDDSKFFITLEEVKNTGFYEANPVDIKRKQICLDCYKQLMNELY